jgi:archaemetzincin
MSAQYRHIGIAALISVVHIAAVAEIHAEPSTAELYKVRKALRPLCVPMDEPGFMDWLANHDEPGQTFKQYLRSKPVTLRKTRKVIYVQPIGKFTEGQERIINDTARFIGIFYGCSVATMKAIDLRVIPDSARRTNGGSEQLLTTYILQDLLRPRLPENAMAYLAFTASDLWPGKGWNFVFGQASLRQRVGVWSLHRFGNPDEGEATAVLCLRRTFKLAVHETGHMFSMRHCTAYKCGMCGSNHLEEADKRPLHFCAECFVKVCWATKADPLRRVQKLTDFLDSKGLDEDAEFYRNAINVIGNPKL